MRGLRTIPVLLDVCRDMEELCPDALLLQYVNPLGLLSSFLAGTVWAFPVAILTGRMLGLLLRPGTRPVPLPLRAAVQVPGWVVALSAVLA